MRLLGKILLTGVMLGSYISMAWAGDASPVFDKPSHETHTPLALDPRNPHAKPMLSCFYYPHFMVKQIDLGEKGAEQLSILPAIKDRAEPPCLRVKAKDEMVIDPKTWSGYFEGVKGDFVFFVADDGLNGGLGFAVYSGTDGAKLFDDVAKSGERAIRFTTLAEQIDPDIDSGTFLKLTYRRVYPAKCSLRDDEKDCWKSIQEVIGLTDAATPNCAVAYETEKKRAPKFADNVDSYDSVIAYEVDVELNLKGTTLRVIPTSKAMECYLAN